MIYGAAAHDLEILRGLAAFGLGVIECVGKADAIKRVLRNAVDEQWRLDTDDLVMVGTMSLTWWNCGRGVVSGLILAGQRTDIGLRVPPKCEARSFVPLYGVLPAHAQPA